MAERSRDRKKRKKEQTEYFFDYSLLFVVLFLMGFGLVMIYSASSYEAQQDFGSGTYYLRKQLVADILGLVVMMVMANIPYRFWQRFTTLAYFASLALIPVVLTPLGVDFFILLRNPQIVFQPILDFISMPEPYFSVFRNLL